MLNEFLRQRNQVVGRIALTMRSGQKLAVALASPFKICCEMQRLWNNWTSVTRISAARKGLALRAQNGDVLKKIYLVLAVPGFGSVQVSDQRHARLVDAAGAAVREEAAPAKGRRFGKLDTELKLMVDFFEQTAEASNIVTVLSVSASQGFAGTGPRQGHRELGPGEEEVQQCSLVGRENIGKDKGKGACFSWGAMEY